MIQDIFPKIYYNQYRHSQPDLKDFVLLFHENTALIRFQDEKLRYPSFEELSAYDFTYIYLFSIDDYRYYMAQAPKTASDSFTLPDYHYENISVFRTAISRHTAFAGITGHHLFNWYENNRFCGRCGEALIPDEAERMLHCPSCHNCIYPKISPAVIVGVKRDKN